MGSADWPEAGYRKQPWHAFYGDFRRWFVLVITPALIRHRCSVKTETGRWQPEHQIITLGSAASLSTASPPKATAEGGTDHRVRLSRQDSGLQNRTGTVGKFRHRLLPGAATGHPSPLSMAPTITTSWNRRRISPPVSAGSSNPDREPTIINAAITFSALLDARPESPGSPSRGRHRSLELWRYAPDRQVARRPAGHSP